MNQPNHHSHPDSVSDYPANWTQEELLQRWNALLISILGEDKSNLPLKRAQTQVRQETLYEDVIRRWPKMQPHERLTAWKSLIRLSENALREVLPTCVACGECCRIGSPSLHADDLELLTKGNIPWGNLITLRCGEPVRSPFQQTMLSLSEERIKIREKPGSRECIFLDSETDHCLIYINRPTQCRAQACWDPKAALGLQKTPYLTRSEIFQGVDLLLDLIEEHDRRCSFGKLVQAFDHLRETRGNSIEEVLQLLAYEDHFRRFLGSQLNIPDENLELVFGRSFAELVPLFGFRIIMEPDGSRCLVPEPTSVENPTSA